MSLKVQRVVKLWWKSLCPEVSRCSCHTCVVSKTEHVAWTCRSLMSDTSPVIKPVDSLVSTQVSELHTASHTFCLFHPESSLSAHKYSCHLLRSVLMQIHHLLHLYLCLCKLKKRQSNSLCWISFFSSFSPQVFEAEMQQDGESRTLTCTRPGTSHKNLSSIRISLWRRLDWSRFPTFLWKWKHETFFHMCLELLHRRRAALWLFGDCGTEVTVYFSGNRHFKIRFWRED